MLIGKENWEIYKGIYTFAFNHYYGYDSLDMDGKIIFRNVVVYCAVRI